MHLRLVAYALWRDRRRTAVRILPVAVGTAILAAWMGLAVALEDRIAADVGAYGVNLVLHPAAELAAGRALGEGVLGERATFPVEDLRGLESRCFWAPNILGHAPVLEGRTAAGVAFAGTWFAPAAGAGLRTILGDAPVRGAWPADGAGEALVGSAAAAAHGLAVGSTLAVGADAVRVVGLLETGESWDEFVWIDLKVAARAMGLPGRAHRAYVRALTTPEKVAAERLGLDPLSLPPEEFERWACTNYPSTVAYDITQSIPSVRAEPIRRVTRAEARLWRRLRAVGVALGGGTLALAILAITSVLAAGVLERRREWATVRLVGGSPGGIRSLLALEGLATGLLGGAVGAALGAGLLAWLSPRIVGAAVALNPAVLAAAVGAGVAVSMLAHLGVAAAVLRQDVPEALHEV